MAPPLLQVQDLSVSFRTGETWNRALRGISFNVQRGEIVALVGESGSGKSVTSLSLLQLLPVPPAVYESGSILFSPEGGPPLDLLQTDAHSLRRLRGNKLAMIFQEPMTSLNPVIRCGEQVSEAILLHRGVSRKAAREQALQWLRRVKLPDPENLYRRYPHQLSGGQKQRVMIAMAMCCEPDLLICDEPTTALDVTVQKTILDLIRELQEQTGMGVIFITHDLGVVAEIAHRALVMYKGEIVEQNSVEEIFEHARHPYTRALLACRPLNHPRGERLPVVADFLDNPEQPFIAKKLGKVKAPALSESNPPLVRVENLSVWFPARQSLFGRAQAYTKAVDDVSFDILEGETLGLVGESGCGKTTLGRTLLRLIEPSAGRIWYREQELTKLPPADLRRLRRELQIVFQDPYSSLNPRMTVGDAITEPLKVHGLGNKEKQRKEKAVALLEKVSLGAEHFNRYPHEFSGGQRQRLVIARALALNPSFIICDESVSALDVSVQAQVLNLLNDLKREFGFTVVFISHDLSVVRYLSDRILVMRQGKILESGPADSIYEAPSDPYTRQLIQAIPGYRSA